MGYRQLEDEIEFTNVSDDAQSDDISVDGESSITKIHIQKLLSKLLPIIIPWIQIQKKKK